MSLTLKGPIKPPPFNKTFKKTLMKNEKLKKFSKEKLSKEKQLVSSMSENYNQQTIQAFEELANIYTKKGDWTRAKSYQKASEILSLIDYDINLESIDKLSKIKGIGVNITNKIKELIEKGVIASLEREKQDPIIILTDIHGIGPKKAEELIDKGILTIQDLKDSDVKLNDIQKLGLEYYDEISQKIPRDEIQKFEIIFNSVFEKYAPHDSKFEIVGSYRRGKPNSGDIDIIITNLNNDQNTLDNILKGLENDKSISIKFLSRGKTKSMAIVKIEKDGIHRRVDFLYTSPQEYSFALLYFTGSKVFNTVVRQKANDLGFTLNEHELSFKQQGVKGKRLDKIFNSEKEILNFLGIEYLEPTDRENAKKIKFIDISKSILPEEEKSKIEKDIFKSSITLSKKIMPPSHSLQTEDKISKNLLIDELILNYSKQGINYLDSLNQKEISKMIKKLDQDYYEEDGSKLSDLKYDKLIDYIEKKFPDIIKKGHTEVDIKVDKKKVKLPYGLYSMNKIKHSHIIDKNKDKISELEKWSKKYKGPYIISSKIDGISALFINKDSKNSFYTRGNGEYGQDISHLIKFIIGTEIPDLEVAIRGEIIIEEKLFQQKYSDKFANSRNFVAGLINKKSLDSTMLNDLSFVPYEVIQPELTPLKQMEFLEENWIHDCVDYRVVEKIDDKILTDIFVEMKSESLYLIDGIIIEDDKIYKRQDKNPEHAFAFKMSLDEQMSQVVVKDVLWGKSKDGVLKPRIQIEPVKIGGVTIEYATGFNAKYIKDNKIGVGSILLIKRSGDVIPHIETVIEEAKEGLMPDIPYEWNKSGVDVIMLGKDDDDTVLQKNITLFFKTLEIEGIGPGNVKKMMDAGFNSIDKILAMNKSDFLKVDGFKEKTADNLYNNIHSKIDKISLAKLMQASNIFGNGFGEKKFKLILDNYPDILESKDDKKSKIDRLNTVDGIAKLTAEKFVNCIDNFNKFIKKANLLNVQSQQKKSIVNHQLTGKKVVFTGFRDKELNKELDLYGIINATSVSKDTLVVVVKTEKDKLDDTSKLTLARKFKIPILSLNEFRNKYKFD